MENQQKNWMHNPEKNISTLSYIKLVYEMIARLK